MHVIGGFRQISKMKKDSKLYKESFNLAKNSFEAVLGKYKPDQIKKIKKTHFFDMTYFQGRPLAQKFKNTLKSQKLNKKYV